MTGLRDATRALSTLCATGAGASMAAVFGIIFCNAVGRYTVGVSLPWGEELPVYLSIYGVGFGVALSYLQDRHIRFTFLTDTLNERKRGGLERVVDLGVLILGVSLAISGVMFMTKRGGMQASGLVATASDMAEATGLSWLKAFATMGTWQAALPMTGGLLALAAALKLLGGTKSDAPSAVEGEGA